MRHASQSQSGQEVRGQRMSVLALSAHRGSAQTALREQKEGERLGALGRGGRECRACSRTWACCLHLPERRRVRA